MTYTYDDRQFLVNLNYCIFNEIERKINNQLWDRLCFYDNSIFSIYLEIREAVFRHYSERRYLV